MISRSNSNIPNLINVPSHDACLLEQLQFLAHETSMMYLVNTTDDNMVETPDEDLVVALYVPGMFPSFLGDLIARVNIEVRRYCQAILKIFDRETDIILVIFQRFSCLGLFFFSRKKGGKITLGKLSRAQNSPM